MKPDERYRLQTIDGLYNNIPRSYYIPWFSKDNHPVGSYQGNQHLSRQSSLFQDAARQTPYPRLYRESYVISSVCPPDRNQPHLYISDYNWNWQWKYKPCFRKYWYHLPWYPHFFHGLSGCYACQKKPWPLLPYHLSNVPILRASYSLQEERHPQEEYIQFRWLLCLSDLVWDPLQLLWVESDCIL